MEVNSKKIYLSIILVLFILFSLLFIPCCNVYAADLTLTIDDFEAFSSYGFNITDYYYYYGQPDIDVVEYFNNYISGASEVDDFLFIQPGGNLYLSNYADPPTNGNMSFFYNKNDLPVSLDYDIYERNSDDVIKNKDRIFSNMNFSRVSLTNSVKGVDFLASDVDYPILIALEKGAEIDYEKSSGISRTFYNSEFGVEVDLTKSSFAPETYGSVVGRVYGTSLPAFGTIEVDLYKENLATGSSDLIEDNLFWIGTLGSDFSFNFECPPLEVGSYSFHAKFIINDEVKYEGTESFELDGTIKDYEALIVRDGESYHVDTAYFNKVFKISSPKHYNLYNNEIWFDINTPLSKDGGFSFKNILGNYAYTDSFALKDVLSDLLGNTFNRKVDVYLNNVLIKEYDFKNFSGVTGYLPSALLNRGKNTLFVVSSQGLPEESSEYFNWLAPDGTYRYIHSAIEFFYKTKEGSGGLIVETDDFSGGSSGGGGGSGGGGAFSDDDMINDGSSGQGYIGFTGLDTPPDRSNYPDDIFGTIGYALDFIFYVISMPFKVLFGALEWLISNFLTLFSWVGQLSALIGSWFNFLPREVRSLLLGGFMCSIIAFVLKLFRK